MKTTLYIFTSLVFSLLIGKENHLGNYSYKNDRYYESIELKEGNKFTYFTKQEFINYEIRGNYTIQGDSLVLNSSPQRDKIIVQESKKGSQKCNVIVVTDKMGIDIHYNLFLILDDNIEIKLANQWEKSKIRDQKIKGFYIIDTKGLKSPIYFKKGKSSNYFKVQLETNRVFDNETWYLNNNKIKPKGLNGEFQNYVLEK
jgi:hypothetical protein